MEDFDRFQVWTSKKLFSKHSKTYHKPKCGDLIRPHYSGIIYEITEVIDTESQFLGKQHIWTITIKVWENDLIGKNNSEESSGEENLQTYDKTNAISTEPPKQLTQINEYLENGSDFLEQNEMVDEIKNDVLYTSDDDIDPFSGW